MPPSAMIGLLVVFSTLGSLNAYSRGRPEEASKCPLSLKTERLQEMCSTLNEALLNAEYEKDVQGVCKFHLKMLWCVAENIKECFDVFMDTMEHYLHSPFSCSLPHEDILKLQQVVYHDSSSGSPKTTPDSAPQPWTNGEEGGAQQGGGGDQPGRGVAGIQTGDGVGKQKGYEIKDPDSHDHSSKDGVGSHGTQEQHKAQSDNDKGSGHPLAAWSLWAVLLLAVTSGRLPWRLIS